MAKYPKNVKKLAKKSLFPIFFGIFWVPGSYLLCIPSFAAMGNGTTLCLCSGRDCRHLGCDIFGDCPRCSFASSFGRLRL